MKRNYALLSILAFSLIASGESHATTLYLSDDDNAGQAIYTVDLATGQATLLGSTVLTVSFSGLAYDSSTGIMYISDVLPTPEVEARIESERNVVEGPEGGGFGLGTVNLTTGEVTYVGSHVTSSNIHGLAYDSLNDILWGADVDNSGCVATIDRGSGAASCVGTWGTTGQIRGLAYDAPSDTLYGIDWSPGSLYTINRTTGAATPVGATGFANGFFVGLEIDPDTDTMYFVEHFTAQLFTVNPATGLATAVGPLGGPIEPSGLAAVGDGSILAIPSLSGLGLAALALALALAATRWMRRLA